MVNALVWVWLYDMVSPELEHLGLQMVVQEHNVGFYMDIGLVSSPDPVWLQDSFDVLINLF